VDPIIEKMDLLWYIRNTSHLMNWERVTET
jgi:hypothetical protein